MIVFINFSGSPVHAVGGLLLCLAFNFLFDLLASGSGSSFLWLELAASALGLLVVGLILAVGFKYLLSPGRPAVLQQFTEGLLGRGDAPRQAGQHLTAQQRQQRWEKMVSALQKLPTETILAQDELQQLTVHELKERLARAGVSCSSAREKSELVDALLQDGGSSAGCCCICVEDYVSGDVVRLLPCKHRFHIECVDKWFLASTDYTRPPACPMCNAELAI